MSIGFINQAQRLGLTLGEIKEIISIRQGGRSACRSAGGRSHGRFETDGGSRPSGILGGSGTTAAVAAASGTPYASMSRIAAAISVGPGSTASSSGGAKGTGTPGLPRRRGAVRSAPKARSVTSAMTSAWMPHVR